MERFLKKPKADPQIPGLRYEANFLTEEEEDALLKHIDASEWDTSLKRRTQHYGFRYDYTTKHASAEPTTPIPDWCTLVIDRLLEKDLLKVRPDQVIVNEYEPGQGIAAHVDSTASFKDGIASVSLGSNVVMDFCHFDQKVSKLLQRQSVIALHGDARYKWSHGIAARRKDNGQNRQRRVSLTFRKMAAL